MWPLQVLAQHQEQSGTAEVIDKLARTPLSQIVILVVICTVLRVGLAPYLFKVPPKHKVTGPYKAARFANEFLDAIIYAGIFVFMVIRPFGVQAFRIPSASMQNTLLINDFIVANKMIYRYSEPKYGDIIVFRPPVYACNPDQLDSDGEPKVDFIKRCIGVPGDLVEIRNGQLYRNGKAVQEKYLAEPFYIDFKLVKYHDQEGKLQYWPVTIEGNGFVNRNATGPFHLDENDPRAKELMALPAEPIPPGYFLPMGDNRNYSSDGRFWGLVDRKDLVGRSEAIWLPLKRMSRTR